LRGYVRLRSSRKTSRPDQKIARQARSYKNIARPVVVEEPCEATPAAQNGLYRSFRPLLTAQTGLNHGFSATALIQKMSLIDLENNCIKTQYIFKH
jgi:hypothetical protein